MPKRHIYLHIGIGKTGTTAIQNFLFVNRKKLFRSGFTYPLIGIENRAHHYLGHSWGIGWMTPRQLKNIKFEKLWYKVRKKYLSHANSVILSAETLSVVFKKKPEAMAEIKDNFLKDCRIKIIVYIRRQDLHAESWHNQRVKVGLTSDKLTADSPLPGVYWYYDYLTSLSKIFGHANIIVRPYEKQQFRGGSIYTDFLKCVAMNINSDDFRLPRKDPNPRISHKTMEFLRIANSIERDWEQKYQFNLIAQELFGAADQNELCEPTSLLSPSDRLNILKRYEKSNKRVAKEFLKRPDGVLFRDPLPDPDKPWRDNTALSIEETVSIAVNIHDRLNNTPKRKFF